jgi:hypothetical protein
VEPTESAGTTPLYTPTTISNTPESSPTEKPTSTQNPTDTPTVHPETSVPIDTSTPEPIQPTQRATASSTPRQNTGPGIIIDHHSVALFDQIPDEYLQAARDLKVMYSNRSVGENINVSLDCLSAPSWGASRPGCRRDYIDENWNWATLNEGDLASGRVPGRIQFDPDPMKYNRDNIIFVEKQGDWFDLTQDFVQVLGPAYMDTHDVLSYQFSYANVAETSDIADPERGFFIDNPDRFDVYDLEAYLSTHPEKTFFFWTTSLSRSTGSQVSTDFNEQMRQYARENGEILFDLADIESHTDLGAPCYDNRDGVPYCDMNGKCEDHPDDGIDFPAICQEYTTEPNGGHLGSVSSGKIRIVKAFWVLLARITGWNP